MSNCDCGISQPVCRCEEADRLKRERDEAVAAGRHHTQYGERQQQAAHEEQQKRIAAEQDRDALAVALGVANRDVERLLGGLTPMVQAAKAEVERLRADNARFRVLPAAEVLGLRDGENIEAAARRVVAQRDMLAASEASLIDAGCSEGAAEAERLRARLATVEKVLSAVQVALKWDCDEATHGALKVAVDAALAPAPAEPALALETTPILDAGGRVVGQHIAERAPWAQLAKTPAPAEPAKPGVLRHRCMRCDNEFDCLSPTACAAGYDVLPVGCPRCSKPQPAPAAPAHTGDCGECAHPTDIDDPACSECLWGGGNQRRFSPRPDPLAHPSAAEAPKPCGYCRGHGWVVEDAGAPSTPCPKCRPSSLDPMQAPSAAEARDHEALTGGKP